MTILDRIALALERDLLRKGPAERAAAGHSCGDCRRIPLVGERVYMYEGGRLACELCKPLHKEVPVHWELVHGPAHGDAVRLRRAPA